MSVARRSTTGHRPMMKHFLHTTASGGSPGEKTVAERPVGAYWQYQRKLSGPDLTQGVELSMVPDGTMLLGHARGQLVFLVRRGDELFAIGAICTHYGAPLEQGLLVGYDAHGTLPASGCGPVRLSGPRRLEFYISIYEGARFS